MWAALRAVVALCCAPALASAPNLAVVWESDEFIATMRASLTTTWELVPLTHETPAATLARATAAVGEVPLQLLGQMPALRLYQSLGYASPRTPEPTTSPPLPTAITFCSAAGSPAQASRVMAEWTVAAALELVFKLGRTDRQMRECEPLPSPRPPAFPPLHRFTAGCVGVKVRVVGRRQQQLPVLLRVRRPPLAVQHHPRHHRLRTHRLRGSNALRTHVQAHHRGRPQGGGAWLPSRAAEHVERGQPRDLPRGGRHRAHLR